MLTFEIMFTGDLIVSLEELCTKGLREKLLAMSNDEAWEFLFSGEDKYRLVRPEEVGALTDSPIITDGEKFWWFPNYMIINEIRLLVEEGDVVFTKE